MTRREMESLDLSSKTNMLWIRALTTGVSFFEEAGKVKRNSSSSSRENPGRQGFNSGVLEAMVRNGGLDGGEVPGAQRRSEGLENFSRSTRHVKGNEITKENEHEDDKMSDSTSAEEKKIWGRKILLYWDIATDEKNMCIVKECSN